MSPRRLPACTVHAIGDPLCHYPRPQAVYRPAPAQPEQWRKLAGDFLGAVCIALIVGTFLIYTGTL